MRWQMGKQTLRVLATAAIVLAIPGAAQARHRPSLRCRIARNNLSLARDHLANAIALGDSLQKVADDRLEVQIWKQRVGRRC